MNSNEALFSYLLRLGDSGLILAQRLSEWTGHGPFLEEDLALTNIALDIFGRSKSLLEYAGSVEGKGRSADDHAFLRSEREFLNPLITEQPNGDYAQTLLRQAFIDCYDLLLYTRLAGCADETLAGIAAKSIKEISYHKRHSFSWVVRFGNGTEESARRLRTALDSLWQFTGELFEMTEVDEVLLEQNIAADLKELEPVWKQEISQLFNDAGISPPSDTFMQTGSRKRMHSEHLGYILAEMQAIPRMYPGAKW